MREKQCWNQKRFQSLISRSGTFVSPFLRPDPQNPKRQGAFGDLLSDIKLIFSPLVFSKIWGWVIYRCTYSSDRDWADLMSRLGFYIQESLQQQNGLDMMESLDYYVLEDKALFDAAKPATVREHFRQRVRDAPQHERSVPAMRSQRYNFCVYIDEDALQSIVSGPPPPGDELDTGYVNLICLDMLGGVRAEFDTDHTQLDRCWIRVTYQDLMPTWYINFRTQRSWFVEYRRPLQVATP
ncbi:hypothetical protein KCU77_g3822, partial [Aureobasidium melanogenum]